jgi:hypothetical protein
MGDPPGEASELYTCVHNPEFATVRTFPTARIRDGGEEITSTLRGNEGPRSATGPGFRAVPNLECCPGLLVEGQEGRER